MPCSRTGRRREQTAADRNIGKASPAPNAQRHAQEQLEGGGRKHCGLAGGRHIWCEECTNIRLEDMRLRVGIAKLRREGWVWMSNSWNGKTYPLGSQKQDERACWCKSQFFKGIQDGVPRTMRGSTQERGHSVSLLKLIRSGQVLLVPLLLPSALGCKKTWSIEAITCHATVRHEILSLNSNYVEQEQSASTRECLQRNKSSWRALSKMCWDSGILTFNAARRL